jgi:hypothetical protein
MSFFTKRNVFNVLALILSLILWVFLEVQFGQNVATVVFWGGVFLFIFIKLTLIEVYKRNQIDKFVHRFAESVYLNYSFPAKHHQHTVTGLIRKIADSGGWKWFEKSSCHEVESHLVWGRSTVLVTFRMTFCPYILLKNDCGGEINPEILSPIDGCLIVHHSQILELAPNFFTGCPEGEQEKYYILVNLYQLGQTLPKEPAIKWSERFLMLFLTGGQVKLGGHKPKQKEESVDPMCLTLVKEKPVE